MTEPPGTGLAAPSPHDPTQVMLHRPLLAGNQDEQSCDLGEGHCDQTGVGGWLLVGGGSAGSVVAQHRRVHR
jgi:hypothetical protein